MVTINNMNIHTNGTSNIYDNSVNQSSQVSVDISPQVIELIKKFEEDAKSNSYTEENLKTRALELSKDVAIGVIGSLGAGVLLSFIGKS